MPPAPSCSRTLYLPMVKPRHLPAMNCCAWKCVSMPSRTSSPANLPAYPGAVSVDGTARIAAFAPSHIRSSVPPRRLGCKSMLLFSRRHGLRFLHLQAPHTDGFVPARRHCHVTAGREGHAAERLGVAVE